METIDYKELLLKYIWHVGESEGISFISEMWKDEIFTEQEWEELLKLNSESLKYYK